MLTQRILFVLAFALLACPSFAVTDEVETFSGTVWPDDADLTGWGQWPADPPTPATVHLTGLGSVAIVATSDAATFQLVQIDRTIGTGDYTMEVVLIPDAIPEGATAAGDKVTFDMNVFDSGTQRFLPTMEVNPTNDGYTLRAVRVSGWSTVGGPVEIGLPSEVRLRLLWEESTFTHSLYYGLNGAPAYIPLVTAEVYSGGSDSGRLVELRSFGRTCGATETYTNLIDHYSLSSVLQIPSTPTPTPSGPTPTPTDTPIISGVRVDEWKDFR